MDDVSTVAQHLFSSDAFNRYEKLETEVESEGVNLFPVAFQKAKRLQKKLKMLRETDSIRLVILTTPNLAMTSVSDPRVREIQLIRELDYRNLLDALITGNKPSIVIFTNNSIPIIGTQSFVQLTENCSNCLFLMHDYDNHHWYRMSVFGALLSDVYVQAHRHSVPFLDTLLPHPTLILPIGVTQWERRFILNSLDKILEAKRSNSPSGMHRFYPRFEQRNRIIATIANHAPQVGFTDSTKFNNQNQEEKLQDWLQSKNQLCAPAGNDIPTRFFDSLITGGLPAIPLRMVNAIRSIGVREDHFISFGPLDLVSPESTIQRWSKRFDELGQEGLISRVTHCIETFHVDQTINKLLEVTFTLAEPDYLSNLD
jgi:hypothetical protein